MTDHRYHGGRGQPGQTIGLTNGFRAMPHQDIHAFSRQPANSGEIRLNRDCKRIITAQGLNISLLAMDIALIPAIGFKLLAKPQVNCIQFRPERDQPVNGDAITGGMELALTCDFLSDLP